MAMSEMFTQLGSVAAGIMFLWAMFRQYFPYELLPHVLKYSHKLVSFVNPYIKITIQEYSAYQWRRNEAYVAIEDYLSSNSSSRARRLKADIIKDSQSVALSMDDHEEVTDEFH